MGVPFGVQTDWLLLITNGCPPASTRVEPVIHCPVMHGSGLVPETNGQPAITCGAAMVTTGWPLTDTLGLGAVGVA